jgi:DNA repair protein RecN (Recombination protein N)
MLLQLTIENYVLIERLDIRPSAGMNVITGETGAGKSIMLGALGLLQGQRAESRVLLNAEKKCLVEGHFHLEAENWKSWFEQNDLDFEEETILRREITGTGKSRAFINDVPVTLELLKEIGAALMDIHSQHETLLLGNVGFQRSVLDSFAGNENLLSLYRKAYRQWAGLRKKVQELEAQQAQDAREFDYLKYQAEEFDQAELIMGEVAQLEQEQNLLNAAENIKAKLHEASEGLRNGEWNAESILLAALKSLRDCARFSPELESIQVRLEGLHSEMVDLNDELEQIAEKTEFSPQRLVEIEDRLSVWYRLQKKHQVQEADGLISLHGQLKARLQAFSSSDEALSSLKLELANAFAEVQKLGKKLHEARLAKADGLAAAVVQGIRTLGISEAVFKVEVNTLEEPSPDGLDVVRMLFSANKGLSPIDLKKAASGGEFSRLMLVVKSLLADGSNLPTLLLDEIDSGISGEVAIKVGELIKEMSARHQIVVITHMPQMAAMGDRHYYVFKDHSGDRTISQMNELSAKERLEAIAAMIGGDSPSEAARKNAKEWLQKGQHSAIQK